MVKKKVIVIGLGEVGKPIYDILMDTKKFDLYCLDISFNYYVSWLMTKNIMGLESVDAMHICVPFFGDGKDFIHDVTWYIKRYKPRLVVIHSTVIPSTTRTIYERVSKVGLQPFMSYSPIRGMHKNMKRDILFWTKFVAGIDEKSLSETLIHLGECNLKVKQFKSVEGLEFAKLVSTSYPAVMIAMMQEFHRIAKSINIDFADALEIINDTDKVRGDRPIYFPDVIGGHCLIQNLKLIRHFYDSKLIDFIFESNKKREEEIKNEDVVKDINMIKEFLDVTMKRDEKPVVIPVVLEELKELKPEEVKEMSREDRLKTYLSFVRRYLPFKQIPNRPKSNNETVFDSIQRRGLTQEEWDRCYGHWKEFIDEGIK